MTEFLKDPKFLLCRQECEYYHFGEVYAPPITWEDVILEIDKATTTKMWSYTNGGKYLEMHLRRAGDIRYVPELLEGYSELDKTKFASAHAYISFSSIGKGTGRHTSKSDVLFWQAIGSTKWVVEGKMVTTIITLLPGHVLYVPHAMYHTVVPLSPRVGISLGLDYLKNDRQTEYE